jgi:hypothetical protein
MTGPQQRRDHYEEVAIPMSTNGDDDQQQSAGRRDTTAVGDWLRDQLAGDQDQAQTRRDHSADPRVHEHNAVTNRRPASAERTDTTAETQPRRGDPVQQARIAVDLLAARRRNIEQQHTARARADQLTQWHRHDRSAESQGRRDGRGIDRGEPGR